MLWPTAGAGEVAIIRITELIWLGDSYDALNANLKENGITAVVNCAVDLNLERWSNLLCVEGFRIPHFVDGVEYVQIGLVDGPGNAMAVYHAVLLKLCSLLMSKKSVLVHDHEMDSRASAVVIMALHALHRRGWDHWLGVIRGKTDNPDLMPHPEHRRAFNRINWRLISSVLDG